MALLALTLGLGALAVFAISYYFHTTTVDVYALSSPDLAAAFDDDADPKVTLEFYDTPVGGVAAGVLDVDTSDIAIEDNVLRVQTSERTRKLPAGTYLQLCVDGQSDGNEECVGTAGADQRVNDRVSCARSTFVPERSWLSSTTPAYVDVRCTTVSSPFTLAYAENTVVEFDGERLDLIDGEIADLTALINQHMIEHPDHDHEDAQLTVENGNLNAQGEAHSDEQTLELVGTELTIANGNTINLAGLLDTNAASAPAGSDDQVIRASLSGTDLTIELENGGVAVVDLSTLTQEDDDQLLNLTASELVLSNGTGADSTIDLSVFLDNTDSFQSVGCVGTTTHILAMTGNTWGCIDPTDAETLTTIGFDASNQLIEYVDEDGVVTSIPLTTLETTTLVSDTLTVGNLIGSYTNEDGTTFDLVETITSIVDNGDQTFTYTSEDGGVSVLDIASMETLTTLTNVVVGNPIGTYPDEDGASFTLNETITTLVDNGNGTFTFTHEDGSQSTLGASDLETLTSLTDVLASGNHIGSYTDEDGTTIDLLETITRHGNNARRSEPRNADDGEQRPCIRTPHRHLHR